MSLISKLKIERKGSFRLLQGRTVLRAKMMESLTSVLPVTIIVLLLSFTIAPVPAELLMSFVVGSVMLIFGIGLFTLGADMSMTPLGERVGSSITKSRKVWLIALVGLIIGTAITISEPDLQVLANQVPTISNWTLIGAVSIGVGIFLVIALMRILLNIPLPHLLLVCYALLFILSAFVSPEFLSIAFDTGGVSTGPMTVPFIMALGVGVTSIRSDKHTGNDSFGLLALCSIGPVLVVMILGMLYRSDTGEYIPIVVNEIGNSVVLWNQFAYSFPKYMGEIAVAMLPIILVFVIFQIVTMKQKKRQIIKMIIGFLYTYIGLVLFMTGVNVGFMPLGNLLGQVISGLSYNWIIIPIGMVIGYFIVAAEPAVHVLNKQVEEITSGAIPRKTMQISLSIAVALSLGISMFRVMTGISILWFILPGYAIAVVLTFLTPKIFTSIAFDSGGVASGTMTATFVLAFAMGACEVYGGNIVEDAFGVIAIVAMIPLITIQILGVFYKIKLKAKPQTDSINDMSDDEDIIELEEGARL